MSLSTASFSKQITQGVDVKNKIGFVGGFGFSVPVSHHFEIQPEILFHQKGWKDSESNGTASGSETYTLNYLEIPVLAKVKFGTFYVTAGPSVAVGLGGNYDYHLSSGSTHVSGSGKIKFGTPASNANPDDVYIDNAVDVGLQLGGGVMLANRIIIDLRYGLGLRNMFNADPSHGLSDNKSKLRSLQLTVGVPLKRNRF